MAAAARLCGRAQTAGPDLGVDGQADLDGAGLDDEEAVGGVPVVRQHQALGDEHGLGLQQHLRPDRRSDTARESRG